jgi:predicted dehydrogenase
MTDVIVLGAAHPHVDYAFAEADACADVNVVAAAEPDPAARARFLGDLTVPVYDNPYVALDAHPADVAVVCGVYSQRAELVVAALERGLAVLVDKPMATDLEQLAAIERSVAAASAPLSIMFDKRFYPETRALQGLVEAGEIGEVVRVSSTGPHKLLRASRPDWFFERTTYGGIAADLPVHDIDILIRLTGLTEGKIAAVTGNRTVPDHPGFEDHVDLLIASDVVQAAIDATWLQPAAAAVHGHYRMQVIGSEGTAEVDWARHLVTVTTHSAAERTVALPAPVRPVQFFFDALRSGQTPAVTAEQSIQVSRIALAAQHSADHGGAWNTF